jgi:hypothetical protein
MPFSTHVEANDFFFLDFGHGVDELTLVLVLVAVHPVDGKKDTL